ncbi:hypothetical protein HY640_03875 [Candidatus Woesearchaeota archaeon]|nr:hypothetical protein [Candidatus Woesearchaeota archaeon]
MNRDCIFQGLGQEDLARVAGQTIPRYSRSIQQGADALTNLILMDESPAHHSADFFDTAKNMQMCEKFENLPTQE